MDKTALAEAWEKLEQLGKLEGELKAKTEEIEALRTWLREKLGPPVAEKVEYLVPSERAESFLFGPQPGMSEEDRQRRQANFVRPDGTVLEAYAPEKKVQP